MNQKSNAVLISTKRDTTNSSNRGKEATRLRENIFMALLATAMLAVIAGNPGLAHAQSDAEGTEVELIEREFGGEDQYEIANALATSFAQRSTSSNSVILAGGNLIDASAAAGLARAISAPIMLTATNELSAEARKFIIEQQVGDVWIIGGEAVISPSVVADLRNLPVASPDDEEPVYTEDGFPATLSEPLKIQRIAGADRYETSVRMALQLGTPGISCFTDKKAAIIANVDNTFADLITAGPLSYSLRWPILLTSQDALPEPVINYLIGAGVDHVVIVGGERAISSGVENSLAGLGVEEVSRVFGATRYETALEIRTMISRCNAIEISPSTLAIINSNDAASGITAGPLLGSGLACNGVTPVLLVEENALPSATREYLAYAKDRIAKIIARDENHPGVFITVIGNESLVSDVVVGEAASAGGVGITEGLVSEQETCLRTYYTRPEIGTFREVDEPPTTTTTVPIIVE